ncbi:hypothetical protein Tco_1080471 [Tanacetum coccineum]|uniref:Uncharacterized protein n=1 Tax=Tanacetum coccineum TaxID=301880 RepID=A0ABQ5HUS5_9ASTR
MTTSKLLSLIVPGQMTHLVASSTLDSARPCIMQGAFLTQGKASSIPTVFSWGDSISPDGFLPSILLLLVIIVAVAIVIMVILVVVVVVKGKGLVKLPHSNEAGANEFHQDKASSVRVPVANFTLQSTTQLLWRNTDSIRASLGPVLVLSVFAMVAACASKAAKTLSATSFLMAS